MDEDTLEKASTIKADLGLHELEVSCGGEADLHKTLSMCEKNPGHKRFIPVQEFNKTHLPQHIQEDEVVNLITAEAAVTTRVSVRKISEARPKKFQYCDTPFPLHNHKGSPNILTSGTARVARVCMFREQDNKPCKCKECGHAAETTRKMEWGEIILETAAHVVYDQLEAEHTSCCFFYDNSSIDPESLLTLNGLDIVKSDPDRDWCRIKYVTHNLELLEMVHKMCLHCIEMGRKAANKFGVGENIGQSCSEGTKPFNIAEDRVAVCVSHPHGCSKQISIGEWTHKKAGERGTWSFYRKEETYDGEKTMYIYNTPTCRGSSGALVFTPIRRWVTGGGWWEGLGHVHCRGETEEEENKNYSTFDWELLEPPV